MAQGFSLRMLRRKLAGLWNFKKAKMPIARLLHECELLGHGSVDLGLTRWSLHGKESERAMPTHTAIAHELAGHTIERAAAKLAQHCSRQHDNRGRFGKQS